MRKPVHKRRYIRFLSCMLAMFVGFGRPCAVMASEILPDVEDGAESMETTDVRYITAFEGLAEEDSYFPCMYKPFLEELFGVFPETLYVWIEGEDAVSQIDVTWICEEDFDNTDFSVYCFYPQWDETMYAVADSVKDSIEIPSIVVEVPIDNGMISDLDGARSSLQDILKNKSILALVYLCDKYEVKESASADSAVVDTVVCGQSVQITDVGLDEDGYIWYQVLFYQGGTAYTGYVERDYLATSDEDFAAWEESNLNFAAMPMMMAYSLEYPDIEQFPASYQNALYALKEKHPNWIFVRMDTGLDWNTVIAKELGDKSLIHTSSSGSWQNGIYGQGWSYASEGILKYYIDPRNFLTDPAIFQFEQLTYNSSYHTTGAVQEILKNSFMSSTIPGDSQTYAQAFTNIGQSLGISPFHLASRVLQEQGSKGTSMLISGTYTGYEGYFNYFNVGASGKSNAQVIQSGLKKAAEMGWNTRYKSLYGGASVIGANYILKGQDTLYLEKFNVSNGQHANFTHQYMQNIQAPSAEASNIRKAYNNAGALENSFVFKIPVYNNMPAYACSKPEMTDVITLNKTEISNLEVNKTTTLIPYVNGSKVDYISNMTFTSSNTAVASVDAQGKVTAISPGTAAISCSRSGTNTAVCTVTVVKADPVVSTPVISPITYQEGLNLSDITLPDGWKWQNGSTKITVGTFSYPAVYTPADTVKYNTITKDVNFTVTKSIPQCQVPENLEARLGDTLGSIVLPSGFAWESDPETELTKTGECTFYVSYNPDENNYYIVRNIPIIVKVVGSTTGGTTSTGSTSVGTTSTGSTTGGTTSTGSTTGGTTSTGSTSAGTTSTGSTSAGTTSAGSTAGGSASTGGTTSTGSTSAGTTSAGSTSAGTTSAGSTSAGTTSTGSTSAGTTSTGSTTGGTTSTGSTTGGSASTGGTTSTGSTSAGTTSAGSTSAGGTTSTGSTTGGNASTGGTTSVGSTSVGTTSTGSTVGGTTSTGSTSVGTTSTGSTSAGTTSAGSTSVGTTSTGSATGGSASTGGTTSVGTTSTGSTVGGTTSTGGTTGGNASTGGTTSAGNTTGGNTLAGNVTNTNNLPGSAPEGNAVGANTTNIVTPASNSGMTNENAVPTDSGDTLIVPQVTVIESGQTEVTGDYKPAVTIQMEDTSILTPEKLQMAKEQNFDLLLDIGDYVTWRIDIDSVDMDSAAEVDMGVTIGTETVPRELIAAILNGNKYIEITLAHDGLFGFDPVLHIALNPENSGKYANLFYYDPELQTLEFICDTLIDANGVAAFPMEHASCYVIIVSDYSMAEALAEKEEEAETDKPAVRRILTGVFIFMVIVVIGCAIFCYCRRRHDDEEIEDEDTSDPEEEYLDDGDEVESEEEYSDNEDEAESEEEYLDDEDEAESEEEYLDDEDEPELEEEYLDDEDELESKEEYLNDEPVKTATAEMIDKSESIKERENSLSIEDVDEDDWIEDEDWHEPDILRTKSIDRFADDHSEDDWIEDDEWDSGNDWMDDDEWERKNKKS